VTYQIFIDPGLSSGIVLGHYSDTEPWTRVAYWQVTGGLGGFMDWWDGMVLLVDDGGVGMWAVDAEWMSEKFIPLSGNGFSHTLGSVEPLRIEGALIALSLMPAEYPAPEWQRADQQYFCGGDNVVEKRKRSKAWLKEHNLYLTGKDVGQKDAEDVISATLHALSWARKHHEPSQRHYWPDTTKAPA